MKRNNSELKRLARETLTGHYGVPMTGMVLISLIPNLLILPFDMNLSNNISQTAIFYIASLFISVLAFLLSCGLCRLHLNMRRKKVYGFRDIFYFFTHHPDRLIRGYFALIGISLLVCLPTLLLAGVCFYFLSMADSASGIFLNNTLLSVIAIILGIILLIPAIPILYNYSFSVYLLIDNSEMTIKAALKKSHHMMKGNRFHLFVLQISFLGWFLLGICSCFIGFLWIEPYYEQTIVSFYFELTGETDRLETQHASSDSASDEQPDIEAYC